MSVVPIRDGIEPEIDVEREMLDYVRDKLKEYREAYGEPPGSIALALIGEPRGDAGSLAHSWSPKNDNASRLHTCGAAATMFMHRALGN